jgi:Ca2+-binding RTX toxin-like protein
VGFGGKNNDTVSGGMGDDTLAGNYGNDNLNGNQNRDLIFGNTGNDIIFGGQGRDTIFAGKNDDLVSGDRGDDWLFGDLGNDTLLGGEGNDTLTTALTTTLTSDGTGNNSGKDVLTGGEGADIFQFFIPNFSLGDIDSVNQNEYYADHIITDFFVGEDSITLIGTDSLDGAWKIEENSSKNAVIYYQNWQIVTLNGVRKAEVLSVPSIFSILP